MAEFGWLLFVVLAALLYYFWSKVRGASFDDLLARMHDEHVRVHKVLHMHPGGGAFADYRRWMRGKV